MEKPNKKNFIIVGLITLFVNILLVLDLSDKSQWWNMLHSVGDFMIGAFLVFLGQYAYKDIKYNKMKKEMIS